MSLQSVRSGAPSGRGGRNGGYDDDYRQPRSGNPGGAGGDEFNRHSRCVEYFFNKVV